MVLLETVSLDKAGVPKKIRANQANLTKNKQGEDATQEGEFKVTSSWVAVRLYDMR